MANYLKLKPIVLKWEGGFSNHPNDTGGATNSGVTLTTFRGAFGRYKTVEDLKNMTDEQWNYIFKRKYWDKWKADEIKDQAIANLIVDWYWMSGTLGVKYPQEVLGVVADGIVGKKTLAAINNHPNKKKLFNDLWNRRKKHFDDIVKYRPSTKVFLRGWYNRLKDFKYE